MKDDLPDGWFFSQIGAVAEVIGGGTPKSTDPANFAENGIAWITPADLSDFSAVWIARGKRCLTKLGFESCSTKMVPRGTVLMSSRAPIGYLAIAANELCTNQGFKSFVLPKGVDPVFVYYWLQHILDEIEHMGSGSTFLEVSGSRCREIRLVVAPLAEQKRIVARVEQLLARVNAARARLARVPAILKRFRQSVLAAACSGRLTADWRQRRQETDSADDLFDTIQVIRAKQHESDVAQAQANGKRRPKDHRKNKRSDTPVTELLEIPESWKACRLEDLTYGISDGTHRTPTYRETGVPFLSVKNVRPFKVLDKDVKRISQAEHEEINRRCNPEVGDLLYTKVGATFGFAAVNRLGYPFSLFVSVALIKPVQRYFTPEYAEIAINSNVVFSQARERVSGSGVPDLHLLEIRDFAIPLPPLAEQQEIVRRVEALFRLADAIEKRLATATARVEKLTQAILAKAFRGELVPTEAELARAEGRNYEPASVLLDRIRADREQLPRRVARRKGQ